MDLLRFSNMLLRKGVTMSRVPYSSDRIYDDPGERCVLAVHGEIDVYVAPLFKRDVSGLEEYKQVVLDLKDLVFMDSTGYNTILAFDRRRSEKPEHFVTGLRNAPPEVRRVLRITRLEEYFELIGSDDWPTKTYAERGPDVSAL